MNIRRLNLHREAIKLTGMERREVDTLETADIDHHSRVAGLIGTTAKRLDATHFAKQMGNLFGMESILGETVFARQKGEIPRRDKSEDEALGFTVRTVTRHRFCQVSRDLILHRFTMTTSSIFRHMLFLLVTNESPLFYTPTYLSAKS